MYTINNIVYINNIIYINNDVNKNTNGRKALVTNEINRTKKKKGIHQWIYMRRLSVVKRNCP